jgi:hypothetical protein
MTLVPITRLPVYNLSPKHDTVQAANRDCCPLCPFWCSYGFGKSETKLHLYLQAWHSPMYLITSRVVREAEITVSEVCLSFLLAFGANFSLVGSRDRRLFLNMPISPGPSSTFQSIPVRPKLVSDITVSLKPTLECPF